MIGKVENKANVRRTVEGIFDASKGARVVASMCGAAKREEVIEALERAIRRGNRLKAPCSTR